MTSRERLLSIFSGEKPDRPAFSPFLSYWWESQSDSLTDQGELAFLKSIGADPLFRGHYPMTAKNYRNAVLFRCHTHDCVITESINGNRKTYQYQTSKGTLTFGYQFAKESNMWFLVDHPVKCEADFEILIHIMEQTTVEADYEQFDAAEKELGDQGLIVPIICPELKSSFQSLLEHWVGTEQIVYAVMDNPALVERTLTAMQRVSAEAAHISAHSNASVFLSWEDTSTTNISPAYYQTYILPEVEMWCDILHAHGKRYMQHACGQLKDLMPLISKSGIDCLESVSPPPTGNVDLLETRALLPARIALVGGIEPTVLLGASMRELEGEAIRLLNGMRGTPYVLSNSDSCPPDVSIDKFMLLGQLAKQEG